MSAPASPARHDPAPSPTLVRIVAYDRPQVYGLLRDGTPERLQHDLLAGHFGKRLSPEEAAELDEHLMAWRQRALGLMTLRDTLLVDPQRGRRVFDLLCRALTRGRAAVPETLAALLPAAPADLAALPADMALPSEVSALARRAAAEGLTLGLVADRYPFPDDLERLLPSPPPSGRAPGENFEQPTGWRWRIAVLLATAGVALLVLPLMVGTIPDHPAGLPLALITLALLIGIKAGPAGFLGALTIWLVANLPGFRHGKSLVEILWPAVPLMALGLGLLTLDRHVRALWRWLRQWLAGDQHSS